MKKIIEYFKLKIFVYKLINRDEGQLTDETVDIKIDGKNYSFPEYIKKQ